jgi:DNA-binding SARP family transcriptional activator
MFEDAVSTAAANPQPPEPSVLGPRSGTPQPIDAAQLVENLPVGIVVTDAEGSVLQFNAAAVELLGHRLLQPGSTCCQILGCRSGPLGAACVSERAATEGERLPEIRVDLSGEEGRRAVWVIGSALAEGTSYAVLHLRPADPGDRRRRTSLGWAPSDQLHLTVLGETRVKTHDGSPDESWLRQRPGQLLKYLVCERGRVVPPEQIADALWPEGDLRALNNVRHFIHSLREKLEPNREKGKASAFIVSHKGGYSLDLNRVRLDADRFEQNIRTGVAAFMSGEGAIAEDSLEEGLALYRGDFLADEPYADWATLERDRMRTLAARAHRLLGELCLRRNHVEGALEQVERLGELEPLDHEVQWALLTLLLRRGRRSDAVRRFAALRQRMLRDFGTEPDFELADVAEAPERPVRLA